MQYLDVERTYFMDSNHVMVMMGRDFTFQSAHFNFKSIDKLIRGKLGQFLEPALNSVKSRLRS